DQDRGDDLPGNTESVLEPAALDLLATCGEPLPKVVYFFLRHAVHDEGYCLGKFEEWAPVQRNKFLPIELKCHRHDRALRSSRGLRRLFSIADNACDLGLFKNRHIKIHSLFSLVIEP